MHQHRIHQQLDAAHEKQSKAIGLTTALAADTHGAAVSALAHQSKELLSGKAFGDVISDFAKTNGKAGAALATTKAADRLNHGEAVSAVATSTAEAAHAGATTPNHPSRRFLFYRSAPTAPRT